MRLIDANALHDNIMKDYNNDLSKTENIAQFLLRIETAPTIYAQSVRHGRWIELPKSCQADYGCSECGAGIGEVKPPYCAYCGARMDGGVDDDKL